MGHLTNIANSIAHLQSTTQLGDYMKKDLPEITETFNKFRESTLAEINATKCTFLVSIK